jgi:hypothetical protein
MKKKSKTAEEKEIFVCDECGQKEELAEYYEGQMYGRCDDCYLEMDFQDDDY